VLDNDSHPYKFKLEYEAKAIHVLQVANPNTSTAQTR
jgi:hypothetical protein